MGRIRLELIIKFSKTNGLWNNEYDPFLRCYFSKQVDPLGKITTLDVPSNYFVHQTGGYHGESSSNDSSTYSTQAIPLVLECNTTHSKIHLDYACIGFHMMCTIHVVPTGNPTAAYYPRLVPIGGSLLYLHDILETYNNNKGDLYVDIVDHSMTKMQVHRLRLDVKVQSIQMSGIQLVPRSVQSNNILIQRRDAIVDSIIKRHVGFYNKNMRPSYSYCNMHVVEYNGDVTGSRLPASTFCMFDTDTCFNLRSNQRKRYIDVRFVCYLMRTALMINDMSQEEFVGQVNRIFQNNLTENISILSKLVSQALIVYTTTCDYVPDQCLGMDVERFIDIFTTLCGDCEDVTRPSYMMACFIILEPTDLLTPATVVTDMNAKPSPVSFIYPAQDISLFLAMQKILRLYVPVMVRGVASMASMQANMNSSSGGTSNDNICHYYTALIPRVWFVSRNTVQTYTSAAMTALGKIQPIRAWEQNTSTSEGVMCTLVLENTSFCSPLMNHLACYLNKSDPMHQILLQRAQASMEKRMQLESQYPSLTSLFIINENRTPVGTSAYDGTEESFSSFYKRVIAVWTYLPMLLWGEKCLDFSVGYQQHNQPGPNTGYGVDYRDFLTLSNRITIMDVLSLSDSEMSLLREVIKQEPPVHLPMMDHSNNNTSEIASKYSAQISQLSSIAGKTSGFNPDQLSKLNSIQYFAKSFESITPSHLETIKEMLRTRKVTEFGFAIHNFPVSSAALSKQHKHNLYLVELRLYFS